MSDPTRSGASAHDGDVTKAPEGAGNAGTAHGDGGAAGHGAHDKAPAKLIGITMAVLGVLLAVCAALVGSHRTSLIKTTVEQSNKYGLYQSEAMKFRVLQGDYEILRSITPKRDEVKKLAETLRAKRGPSGRADDEDTAELKDLIASSTEDLADLLSPDEEEKVRFQKLTLRYAHDLAEAKEDAEAYEPAIEAHHEAAEWYERAQLAAEIGLVIASIALLLGSRVAWAASLVMGAVCVIVVGTTLVRTHAAVEAARAHIADAARHEAEMEKQEAPGEGEH